MKICHVITRMIVGGAQENTLLSCRGILESGGKHQCTLVTGPSPGPEGELLKNAHYADGIEIVECPYLVREISVWNDLRAYFFLKRFFRERNFDVVHTHSSKAGIIGRLAAGAARRRTRARMLIAHTVHGLAFHRCGAPWKNGLYILMERLGARSSDRIYAVAQAMIDQCLDAGIGRKDLFKVVYSGMELEPFLNSKPDGKLRQELGIPENAEVLGTLARLFPEKGYEQLFEVLPELMKRRPDLHLLLVGDGSLRPKLEETAEKLGFRKRISFAGLVPPSEVHRYLALMDLLVHFSMHEGLPRAAVQALASGKPVVAYPLDGTPEVVLDGKTGRLVPPGSPNKAGEAILFLLADPETRKIMGETGRELVKERFDWKRMSDILLEDYEDSLNSP